MAVIGALQFANLADEVRQLLAELHRLAAQLLVLLADARDLLKGETLLGKVNDPAEIQLWKKITLHGNGKDQEREA